MLLTVLCDNTAGGKCLAEHGLSYFIEYKNERILFDAGHSDVYLKNAATLGINLQEQVSTIVLSHGHWDHGDGLQYISNKTLISHPKVCMQRYRKSDATYIGLALSETALSQKFNWKKYAMPYYLHKNILFLGEIPRIQAFESQQTPFIDKNGVDDFVPDDSALVIMKEDALVIVVGCAHAGICNIVEYAMKITRINKIEAVIGGFHLKKKDEQTLQAIEYLKNINVKKIYPAHCTELPALSLFFDVFHIKQVKTGLIMEL
ncbi:MAG: MBL fold metallo-hydrolase [Bacteroidales bacterium]|jgi:7,8-dihydropterin-6-yl-methyl-4-(beta-D-ribofuranosyl)aminobenzene 5'-phosphate synthase|nr:MBL fold metallo-hydrolase [Bacteroidales bacterium]MDD4209985.1 MBL fold metallo-hydrolase [Bacteroidales bacterium]MDY0015709.1 MBL fold metallo-hydrolase [Bacteroidales bacterium]